MENLKRTPLQLGRTKTLKKLADANKHGGLVLPAVERHVLSKPRDISRRTDVLHPSEIVRNDWCHRASYYLLQGHSPASDNRRGYKTHFVFQMGHAIHEIWQSLFADMGVLYGTWECNHCGYVCRKITNKPACPLHGEDTTWKYREVPTVDPELRISGLSDGILVGFGEPMLLEIKSMSKGTFIMEDRMAWAAAEQNYDTAWKNFNTPFVKHALQAQLYMKLLENSPIAPQRALMLYYSKPDNETKEFIVNKSDFGVQEIIDDVRKIIRAIEEQEAPLCNIKGTTKCPKCEVYP